MSSEKVVVVGIAIRFPNVATKLCNPPGKNPSPQLELEIVYPTDRTRWFGIGRAVTSLNGLNCLNCNPDLQPGLRSRLVVIASFRKPPREK